MTISWQKARVGLVIVLWAVFMLPFIVYAIGFGVAGLTRDLTGETYLFEQRGRVGNAAIFTHMLLGGLLTLLVPLQLVGPLRRRARAIHRWTGRALLAGSVVIAVGGLSYIALRGTIGGWPMNASFGAFGVVFLVCAVMTWSSARAGDITRHRNWGLRFFVLALGAWLYRLHYTVWEIATGGIWREPDFSGAFDLVTLVAFWVPYLVAVELWLARHPRVPLP